MGFYCDNCGAEVEINSDECPRCGVLFKAVKCPRCDYTGRAGEFHDGCPRCAYLKKSSPDRKKRFKKGWSDRVFWTLGFLLLLLLPLLIFLLLRF